MMEALKPEIKKLSKAKNIEADVYVHKLMYDSMFELSYTIENAATPPFITQEKDQKLFRDEMKKVALNILEQGKVNLENCKSIIQENMLKEDNFDSCDSKENNKIKDTWKKISVSSIRPKVFKINHKAANNCEIIDYHVSRGRHKIVDLIPDANKCTASYSIAMFEKAINSNSYINQELVLAEIVEDFQKFIKSNIKDLNNLKLHNDFISNIKQLYQPTK